MNRNIRVTNLNRLSVFTFLILLAGTLLVCRTAQAQCALYPIALHTQTLASVGPGGELPDIWNGTEPGNFGWLSWTDDPGEPTLVISLIQPGDSSTYVNPDVPGDHQVNAGDWVSVKPGVSNGKHVRAALNALIGKSIVVPVWDQVRGQGDNAAYHILTFAIVEIKDYHLPSQNQISARFVGYSDCDGSPPPPPPPMEN